MAIKFSQFNLRTDHTSGMYLVGYDGNQNIHITVDNLFDDFINGTENTIAMFGTGGTALADSILSQDAGATILTVAGQLNVDAAATFDTSITVTGDSTLNGNVALGDASADLITQTGTLYLNGPVKDTTNTLGDTDKILVSDGNGELTFQKLSETHVRSAELVVQSIKANEALTKGDPVYIVGYQVGQEVNIVAKADASNAAKMPATGIIDDDYASQAFGTMTAFGSFNTDFDASGGTENWQIGDTLFVKAGGGLTNIKPTGSDLIQNVAIVSRNHPQTGELEVVALGRTNDIPNLTPGKIWVGSTGNTIESSSITFTEATGAVQLNQYGSGTITGTAAHNLSVDSSGNIIETVAVPTNIVETLTAASGTYISLTDATSATGDVDLGTFDLSAVNGIAAAGERYLTKNNTWAEVATIPGTYTFDVSDGATSTTINSGDTLSILGGTYITTSNTTGNVTINHDATARADTTSTSSPGVGGTFTAVDSVTTNATGHIEAINLKTVTLPDDGVDGSGTLNYVPKWTPDGDTLGNSVIYDDGTNVGIGETDPDTILHITGNEPTIKLEDNVGADFYNPKIEFFSSSEGGTLEYISNPNFTGMRLHYKSFFPTADTFLNLKNGLGEFQSVGITGGTTLKTDGVLQVTGSNNSYFSNGNVGIGTTNPLAKLDVNGNFRINTNNLTLSATPSWGVPTQNIIGAEDNTNGATLTLMNTSATIPAGGVSGTLQFVALDDARNSGGSGYAIATISALSTSAPASGNGGGGNLIFKTAASYSNIAERMRINPSGDVGIGTTNPAQKLHVEGNALIDSYSASGTEGGIYFREGFYNYNVSILTYDHDGATGPTDGLSINGYDGVSFCTGSNTRNERMRITSTGNVGIGTDSPFDKLHVEGTVRADSPGTSDWAFLGYNNLNTAASGIWFDNGDGELLLRDDANNLNVRLRSDSDSYFNGGNVGIGTTSPSQKLEINTSGSTNYQLRIGTNEFYYDIGRNTSDGFLHFYGNQSNASGFVFKTVNGERVRIDHDGNVGIGTTSPSQKLEVSGSSVPTIRIDNTKNGIWTAGEDFGGLEWYGNDASGEGAGVKGYIKLDSDNIYGAGFDMRFGTTDGTNGITERMVITKAGNVGIGTTSPGQELEVNGNIQATGARSISSLFDANNYIRIESNSSGGVLKGTDGGIVTTLVRTYGNSYFNGGNFGIGTTSPSHKLDVDGYIAADRYVDTDNASFYLEPGSGATGQWKVQTPSGYVSIGPNNSGFCHFYTDRSQYFFDKKIAVDSGIIASYNEDLTFQAPTNTTRMVIDSSTGNVGIGTTTPSYQLQLSLNSAAKPTSSLWTVVSDERVKTNIRSYKTGLQELLQVEPKLFDYNGKAGFDSSVKDNIGIIAQEIKDIMPETVKKYKAKLNESDVEETELYNFDGHAITFALINAVKELNAKIEELQNKIQILKQND